MVFFLIIKGFTCLPQARSDIFNIKSKNKQMKKLTIVFIFSVLNCVGFAQEYFFEFLPGWRNYKIIETDNNYLSFGLEDSSIFQNFYQLSLFNFQGQFDTSWSFKIDTSYTTELIRTNSIQNHGGYEFIAGLMRGENSDEIYGLISRFDSAFQNVLYSRAYDLGLDTRMQILLPIENNLLIVGGDVMVEPYIYNSALYAMDTLGNILWSHMFECGDNCHLIAFHILKASDGGYFYTVKKFYSLGQPEYTEKTTIIKTDSLGNEQYRLHPGNPDLFTVAGWVLPTDDSNYITAYSDPDTITDYLPQVNDHATIWIKKFDIVGNQIFKESLWDYLPRTELTDRGFHYYIKQMLLTNDNNIIIVGNKKGIKDMGFILKITQQGEPLWYRFISPPQAEGNDAAFESTKILGITPTSDGGYIMAGEYISTAGNIFPEDIQTAIAVKVDQYGCLEPGCQLADAIAEIPKADLGLRIWPNPAGETINVVVAENIKVAKVRVYEVTGRVVLSQSPQPPSPRGRRLSVDVNGLVPGMYLIEVETDSGQREVKRVVIK